MGGVGIPFPRSEGDDLQSGLVYSGSHGEGRYLVAGSCARGDVAERALRSCCYDTLCLRIAICGRGAEARPRILVDNTEGQRLGLVICASGVATRPGVDGGC